MKVTFLFVALALLPFLTMGQTDNLETEIMNYSPSKSNFISKARQLLLDSFMVEDLDKVEEVKDYLKQEMEDQDYVVLFPAEYWLLLYWTEEYEELLGSINGFNNQILLDMQHQIKPLPDLLYTKLLERSVIQNTKLKWKIEKAGITQEEKQLLELNLAFLLNDDSKQEGQDRINDRADEFLAEYPESAYEDFVRKQLRYRFEPSDWGLGFELFSGYGIFTGELGEAFSNPVPFGIGLDLEYKKFTMYVRISGGIGKNAHEQIDIHDHVWEEGEPSNTFLGDVSFGYAVLDTKRFKLSPFAGIGVAEISAPVDDVDRNPELKHFKIGSDLTYSIGANLDYKLNWTSGGYIPNLKSYWYIRLRYGYVMPQFSGPIQGNLHTITLSIGGVTRGIKRVL